MRKASLNLFLIISSYAVAMPVFAQEPPGPATKEFLGILARLTNWMLAVLMVVTVAFIVYAAYLYLTSQGDVEKVKTANRVILYAVVAVAVALLAYVFINIVTALVRPTAPTTTPGGAPPSYIWQNPSPFGK